MGKISYTFILAALSLYLCNGLFACAYGHSVVFGPEIYSSESGKSQRVVKRFSVHDVNQKFFISVQSGKGSEQGVVGASIDLNGERIVSHDEIGKQFKMLAKPVNLKKQNDITVEVTGESESPVIVTIMSLKAQAVTANISPLGGRLNIAEYVLITFPAGAFDTTQEVRMSLNASPSTQDIFEATALGPRLPYEIRINTGNQAPATTVAIGITYPDSFFSSDYRMQICARMYINPDAPDMNDKFCLIDSGVSHTGEIITSLPKQVFSNHYGKNGTYEAIITVVLTQ